MFDLDQYVSTHFRSVNRSGDERIVTCIYCGKAGKMYINVRKKKIYCFRCGAGQGATVISFIMDHLGVDENTAFNIIRSNEYTGYAPQTYVEAFEQQIRKPTRDTILPEEYEALYPLEAMSDAILGQRAIAYLRKRGLTDADFLLYRLGYCASGRYRHRIIVPVTLDGEIVYFVARLFFGWGKRYLNPSTSEVKESPANIIVNWDAAKTAKTLRLCEGAFDQMALGDSAGALLGKQIHDGQYRLLEAGTFDEIEIWLDPEEQKDAERIAFDLRGFGKPVSVCQLAYGDPGETKTKEIPMVKYESTGWAAHFKRRYFSEVSYDSTRTATSPPPSSPEATRHPVRQTDLGHSRSRR